MSSFSTAAESVPVPSWAAKIIGLSPDKVARNIVLCEYEKYDGFLSYIGEHAVDVDVDASNSSMNGVASSNLLTTVLDTAYDNGEEEDEEYARENLSLVFGLGNAHMQYNGKPVCFLDIAHEVPIRNYEDKPSLFRALHIFSESTQVLRSFVNEVADWVHTKENPKREKKSGKFNLYVLRQGCGQVEWNYLGRKSSRSLESIILSQGTLDAIVSDFKSFIAQGTRSWYSLHGLPYRRSWLFYGPPGTGKTSTIRCLSGVLGLDTYFLSLGTDKFGNEELQTAIQDMDTPSMLVIEDVDALFNEDRKSANSSPLTFSGLLNALDGLVASEGGVLTVMTTNHKERLDPALIRAGRIDRAFEFGSPNKDQIARLFLSFYPDADKSLAQKFADAVFARPEKQAKSIATLQEHFIYTRGKTAAESCGLLNAFFSEVYPEKQEQEREFEKRMRKRTEESRKVDEDEGDEGDVAENETENCD